MNKSSKINNISKKILCVVLSLIILCFILVMGVNAYVLLNQRDNIIPLQYIPKVEDIDCVLVLGCGVNGNEPSDMLEDRILTGVDAYKLCENAVLFMSGDHSTEYYNEVDVMKNYAVKKGINAEKIKIDPYGISTYDSIYRALNEYGYRKIIIVTQRYHLYRALYIANHSGLEAYGVSADIRQYVSPVWRNTREVLARDKDVVKCIFHLPSQYTGRE